MSQNYSFFVYCFWLKLSIFISSVSALGKHHCSKPDTRWCGIATAIYQATDCDGDGYIDQYCRFSDGVVYARLSKENCKMFELKLGSSPVTCASLLGKPH